MNYPLAFQLLRQLSPREVDHFGQLLATPAFNKRTELNHLLLWWRKHPHEMPNRPTVFKLVCPEKPYLDRDWYLMLSRLQQLLEQYLSWEEIKRDQLRSYPLLLQSFRRRKLSSFFERVHRQAKALLKKRLRSDASTLYRAYALENSYYDYIASHDRAAYTNLQDVSDHLDQFFIAEKLKQACLAHSRGLANQEEYNIGFLSAIEQQLHQHPALQEVPAIKIYHACYRAVVLGGDKADFRLLRIVMEELHERFPPQEMRDVYLLAINYCIKALNRGQELFIAEALALYERSLELGYLLEDGHIPESTFSNIVSLGLKLNRQSWVATFIEEQAVHLRLEFRAPLTGLSLARLHYSQQQAEQALEHLARVETKAPFLYLGVKSLQLKILYEIEAWDALDSLLDSFRVYLQRRQDLGYRREHYQHLIVFTRRLLQIPKEDKASRLALVRDIKNAKALQEKQWFLERLA